MPGGNHVTQSDLKENRVSARCEDRIRQGRGGLFLDNQPRSHAAARRGVEAVSALTEAVWSRSTSCIARPVAPNYLHTRHERPRKRVERHYRRSNHVCRNRHPCALRLDTVSG